MEKEKQNAIREERKHNFYNSKLNDATQLLRITGSNITTSNFSFQDSLLPFQGDHENLIDRFDGRNLLTFVEEVKENLEHIDIEENEEELNFERYRELVEAEFMDFNEEIVIKEIEENWNDLLLKKKKLPNKNNSKRVLEENFENLIENYYDLSREHFKSLNSIALKNYRINNFQLNLESNLRDIENNFDNGLNKNPYKKNDLKKKMSRRERRRNKQADVRMRKQNSTYFQNNDNKSTTSSSSSSESEEEDKKSKISNIEFITSFGEDQSSSHSESETKIYNDTEIHLSISGLNNPLDKEEFVISEKKITNVEDDFKTSQNIQPSFNFKQTSKFKKLNSTKFNTLRSSLSQKKMIDIGGADEEPLTNDAFSPLKNLTPAQRLKELARSGLQSAMKEKEIKKRSSIINSVSNELDLVRDPKNNLVDEVLKNTYNDGAKSKLRSHSQRSSLRSRSRSRSTSSEVQRGTGSNSLKKEVDKQPRLGSNSNDDTNHSYSMKELEDINLSPAVLTIPKNGLARNETVKGGHVQEVMKGRDHAQEVMNGGDHAQEVMKGGGPGPTMVKSLVQVLQVGEKGQGVMRIDHARGVGNEETIERGQIVMKEEEGGLGLIALRSGKKDLELTKKEEDIPIDLDQEV
ncbi:hypothetical protein HDU92_002020 [Lobulomyces angularis]|nr:hypothetical protein HDU92_002020 [Lobulomyces angularis]